MFTIDSNFVAATVKDSCPITELRGVKLHICKSSFLYQHEEPGPAACMTPGFMHLIDWEHLAPAENNSCAVHYAGSLLNLKEL